MADQPMSRRHLPTLALAFATLAGGAAAEEPPRALFREWCGGCHFDDAAEGGVDLDGLLEDPAPPPAPGSPAHATWVAVWENLRAETMPPADDARPTAADRRRMIDFVSREMLGVDAARPDPGRVVLRRLNRIEYANTVHDLTGVGANLLDELPPDDTGYGFDTVAEVLTLSPLLMEKYVALAARVGERVAAKATERGSGKGYPTPLRPLFPEGPPPEDPAARPAHLRATLRRLAERAFRRPVDEPTVDRLVALAESTMAAAGGTFEKALGTAVAAVMSAPRFLFRIEDDVPGDVPAGSGAALIDEFALASRLSYFLWSTMPDDELFRLAAEGRLRDELPRQIERMVQDRRCDAFVGNFVGQWLQLRDVESLPFDARRILGTNTREEAERIFTPEVRGAMRRETEMLFAHVLRNGLPAADLLVGTQTFLNGPLATFYGIDGVKGPEMRLVDLPPEAHRGGLLTHGSILLVTSNPTRTSPVKRGLFILDNLLGTPTPPAPPNVPPLDQAAAAIGKEASMRETMELHRRDALCASCHARMDPLGLALERYDAIGRWRDGAAAEAVDTSGRLVTGEAFAGVPELAATIAGPRGRDFHRCLTEKMLTYGLGRGFDYSDGPAVDTIVDRLEQEDGRLVSVVQGVVTSVPFQMRRTVSAPRPAPEPAVEAAP